MKIFYWYAGSVVVLFILIFIAVVSYSSNHTPRSPGNDSALVMMMALAGPFVALWFIALGWVVAIFWRRFVTHDPSLSLTTFVFSVVALFLVIKSPYDVYKNFFSSSEPTSAEKSAPPTTNE